VDTHFIAEDPHLLVDSADPLTSLLLRIYLLLAILFAYLPTALLTLRSLRVPADAADLLLARRRRGSNDCLLIPQPTAYLSTLTP
jgi:hypothetical protein